MSEIKIDKNVPLPSETRGRRQKYPFAKMKVGDSFFVARKAAGFSTHIGAGRRYGMRFTRRGVAGGTRIWRIA